jgi:hypothetical protein
MSSSFLSLTNYCIAEYTPVSLADSSPSNIFSTIFYKLDNSYISAKQIYNTNAYRSITKNSKDLSLVSLSGSRSIYLDPTLSPDYAAYDNGLTETLIDSNYSEDQVFERVKFHFASGFNFSEISNLVVGVKHLLNDSTQLVLSNIVLDAETTQEVFTYNLRPLFIANTIYDKYVEILIPSVPRLNQDFDQFGSLSLAHQLTDGIGFSKSASPVIFLGEAAYEEYNAPNNVTYARYQINNYYEAPVSKQNRFDALGCHLIEAVDGDYIEFFATWNGAFPEDIIANLNSSGASQDWIIVHQLQVYEHVGGSTLPSSNQLLYQEDNFDKPLYFRPILRNAGFAFAMSIDYTIRLLNRKGSEQVIKTASLSVINPNKYGLSLTRLNLPDGPQSMKVYNKIIQQNYATNSIFTPKSAQVGSGNPLTPVGTGQIQTVEVKIPQYLPIKQANIRLSSRNALNQAGDESVEVVYGQGRLIIPIDPTDNFIKFIVYQANPLDSTKQNRVNLNNNSEFRLVFGKTNDFVFAPVNDATLTNPSNGEICFKVSKDFSKPLLETTDQHFHISLVNKLTGSETMLYSGTWTPSENYADLIAGEEDAQATLANEATIADLQKQIADLTAQIEELNDQLENSAPASSSLPASAQSSGMSGVLSGLNAAQSAAVNSSQMD